MTNAELMGVAVILVVIAGILRLFQAIIRFLEK